jgi:hypothetical protein
VTQLEAIEELLSELEAHVEQRPRALEANAEKPLSATNAGVGTVKPWDKDGCGALWYWKQYSARPNTTVNMTPHRGTRRSSKYDLASDLRGQNEMCQAHWSGVKYAEAAPRFFSLCSSTILVR